MTAYTFRIFNNPAKSTREQCESLRWEAFTF
jgi:hypothetical protein